MSSRFGNILQIQIFGESHGTAIGVAIDGLPAGENIDMEMLTAFMARRAPGQSSFVTQRKESDRPEFLSGLYREHTTGSPLTAIIRNSDTRSGDYTPFAERPRPSHADYCAAIKYGGSADMRGGGHFSGRLTAPLCIAGGIAIQCLKRRGIDIAARLIQVGKVQCSTFSPLSVTSDDLNAARTAPLSIPNEDERHAVENLLKDIASEGDSVGALIEVCAIGIPTGLGNPMFDGVENRLASALFGIPGVRGISFGAGFEAVKMTGSQHNDPFILKNDMVQTATNHAGGVLGGITTGMPLLVRVAMKPTPSIAKSQHTVDLAKKENTSLTIKGRHDPCIGIRAVPVVEAVLAAVLLDLLLEEGDRHGIN